ncbi:release factor glutamine methyltransferase [mine drainage metagenome]|uniref:peptide chain release factor N(5)-glutamine methyltransferase n=1 Tax=mine drainage metagenome TaxID=410659 RepID=A0A1J5RL15_9ZZZZ
MTITVRAAWIEAQKRIVDSLQLEASEAKFEAQLLLQTALKVSRAWLLSHENDALQANIHAEFESLLSRRLQGEPIAYILGQREFYGLDLIVTPNTLIPRPDTETLVEVALVKIPDNTNYSILDLGTGTGAVALAIAKHRPQASIIAVDASHGALDVAKKNVSALAITNVQCLLSNWFAALEGGRFDVIVSNPPYIEQDDQHLTQGDLRFEPLSALASGADGLDDIRQIIGNCLIHLKPQGWLMLEHGYNQAELVADLMAQNGLVNIETINDFGGNDRVTIGKNPLIVSTHWD